MTGSRVDTGLLPSNVTRSAAAAASTHAAIAVRSVTAKWRGTYISPGYAPAGAAILGPNAQTETSSAGSRESREPPAAEKAASRPGSEDPPERGEERPSQPSDVPYAPPAGPR